MSEPLDPTVREALIELMFVAAAADGDVGPEERAEILANVEALEGAPLDTPAFEAHLARTEATLEREGRAAALAAISVKLPADARVDAFATLVRMSAADGIVRTSEREVIFEAAEALGIESGLAADIVRDASRELSRQQATGNRQWEQGRAVTRCLSPVLADRAHCLLPVACCLLPVLPNS